MMGIAHQLPIWIVWHPADGEEGPQDGQTFRAYDGKEAAELWAKRHEDFNCEYTLDVEPKTVMACCSDDLEDVQTFVVSAQTRRHYYATEKGYDACFFRILDLLFVC